MLETKKRQLRRLRWDRDVGLTSLDESKMRHRYIQDETLVLLETWPRPRVHHVTTTLKKNNIFVKEALFQFIDSTDRRLWITSCVVYTVWLFTTEQDRLHSWVVCTVVSTVCTWLNILSSKTLCAFKAVLENNVRIHFVLTAAVKWFFAFINSWRVNLIINYRLATSDSTHISIPVCA